jgi:signal peptidase
MQRFGQTIIAAGALTAALVVWLLLAPASLGGSASYVIPYGDSMEPSIHRGDLAVVREASSYEPGDVVAYRSRQLHRIVLHRIVSRAGDNLVLKGDNNDFLDPERPKRGQLVGKLWVRVPVAGRFLAVLHKPAAAAAAAALIALLLVGGSAPGRRRRRGAAPAPGKVAPTLGALGTRALAGDPVALAPLILLAGSLVVAGLAFSRPVSQVVSRPGLYEQSGTFSYSGSARRGAAYPAGVVRTGEPVFLRLVDRLDVRFAYRLRSEGERSVGGTARLVAELQAPNGWRRTIPLAATRRFDGDSVELRGTLELDRLRALIRELERTTGARADSYAFALRPEIRLEGSVAGQRVAETFAPALAMRLNAVQLALETTDVPGAAANTSLDRTQQGSGRRSVASTVSLGPLSLAVPRLRVVALLGILLGLMAAALAALHGRRTGGDEAAEIAARYGPLLVEAAPRARREAVRDVETMDGLVRLAQRYERMILHERDGAAHAYLVEDDGVVYRYRTGPVPGEPEPRLRVIG